MSSLLSDLVPLPQLCYWIITEKICPKHTDPWDGYVEWLNAGAVCGARHEGGNRISPPILEILPRIQSGLGSGGEGTQCEEIQVSLWWKVKPCHVPHGQAAAVMLGLKNTSPVS